MTDNIIHFLLLRPLVEAEEATAGITTGGDDADGDDFRSGEEGISYVMIVKGKCVIRMCR